MKKIMLFLYFAVLARHLREGWRDRGIEGERECVAGKEGGREGEEKEKWEGRSKQNCWLMDREFQFFKLKRVLGIS